jgi:UDP-xylose/UDP-N-acetylglucosamine transporter B4
MFSRYNTTQIASVLLVTVGVFLTTLSATPSAPTSNFTASSNDTWKYASGIAILSLALVFAGFLGLAQDWTYTTYGRPQPSSAKSATESDSLPPQWQESLFYLHFLSLPMFFFLRNDIAAQAQLVSNGPRARWSTSFPLPVTISPFLSTQNVSFVTISQTKEEAGMLNLSFHVPYAYTPLLLNTITQLICASGVHRLTTRVNSLTVTLILVIRKAVSLLLSVLGAGIIPGVGGGKTRMVDHQMMWSGAAFVLVGTVLYSIGTKKRHPATTKGEKGKRE